MTQVTVRDVPESARFEAYVGDRLAGFAAYTLGDGVITFTHTEVDDECEGEGVGSTLVRAALDQVRAGDRRVRPLCPFVKAWVDHHPDYQDLVRRR